MWVKVRLTDKDEEADGVGVAPERVLLLVGVKVGVNETVAVRVADAVAVDGRVREWVGVPTEREMVGVNVADNEWVPERVGDKVDVTVGVAPLTNCSECNTTNTRTRQNR
eukprot:Sspe_Gene.117437::Locus_108613_Transcript_1_2_Confidence_0.667_Length_544::g.117437::m.117437